jgi:hypothetical protein
MQVKNSDSVSICVYTWQQTFGHAFSKSTQSYTLSRPKPLVLYSVRALHKEPCGCIKHVLVMNTTQSDLWLWLGHAFCAHSDLI